MGIATSCNRAWGWELFDGLALKGMLILEGPEKVSFCSAEYVDVMLFEIGACVGPSRPVVLSFETVGILKSNVERG